jgi:hypothetical protein
MCCDVGGLDELNGSMRLAAGHRHIAHRAPIIAVAEREGDDCLAGMNLLQQRPNFDLGGSRAEQEICDGRSQDRGQARRAAQLFRDQHDLADATLARILPESGDA